MVHPSAFAVASWLAEGEVLWCLSGMRGFLQSQRIPSCSPLLSAFSHGMGCTILSSELSLGGPEQIERILCVVSTDAFKCFFPPNILQVLGYVGYCLNCWLAKALEYIAELRLCHLGRLYIPRTEQI